VLTTDDMRWFWRHYLSREEQGREMTASPIRAKSLADPAARAGDHRGCDPLRDEGDAYAARLRDAGVAVTLTPYPGMFHGFLRMTRISTSLACCSTRSRAP
jgi:acetyl esterase